jgi:site-specific DNA-methyltransferase (adenine-specific)
MSADTVSAHLPQPYYTDDSCTIYHADCREILPALTADAFVTDPPYGIALRTKMVRNRGGGSHPVGQASVLYADDPAEVATLITQVMPLLRASAARGAIFCGPAMLWQYPEPDGIGAVYLPAGTGISRWGFVGWQPILYYGACPYLATGQGNRPNSFPGRGTAAAVDHPCPKPVEWMHWAVERVTLPGHLLIDPFMGSGTTLRAAKDLGRKAIGIEVEERYCEVAAQRLGQEVLQW